MQMGFSTKDTKRIATSQILEFRQILVSISHLVSANLWNMKYVEKG